jgi:hypothetical protein
MKVPILFTDEGYDLASGKYKIGINCVSVPFLLEMER